MEEKDEKKKFGNYLGIVIQNNDPDQYGRVKVFIPHLTPLSDPSWLDGQADRSIDSILGDNVNGDTSPILNELKQILPWAEYAGPLVGESATGRFNNYNETGTKSYSNFLDTITQGTSGADGNAPHSLYDEEITFSDAFNTAEFYANRPNPLAYNYTPNAYNNAARGSFSIPSVGAHVWVFFREGNIQFPVYFASSYGQEDWAGIFGDKGVNDYPGTYENRSAGTTDDNADANTYRNKYVINQKGGNLEFVNTDLGEKVVLGQYSGSHYEMNNQATIELATANKNTLVANDYYETVNGFRNEFTQKDFDEIVLRDKYKKVGNLDRASFQEWKDIVGPIQEFKQLFEIKRTGNNDVRSPDGFVTVNRNSDLQEQSGTFGANPAGTEVIPTLAGQSSSSPGALGTYDNTNSVVILTGNASGPSGASPSVSEPSPSTQGGTWEIDERKDQLKEILDANLEELTNIEKGLGIGGSEIISISKNKVETIGLEMNDFGSIRYDPIGKFTSSEIKSSGGTVYVDGEGSPLVEYVHVQDLPGGTSTLNVANRYNVIVGAGGLNLKSYGPTNVVGTITNVTGEQVNVGSSNEVNIDGKVVNISADILRLRNKRQRQILVDGSLGVSKNVLIGGGMLVEGETYLQHVTAPREYQLTELTGARLIPGSTYTASFNGSINESGGTWSGTITVNSSSQIVADHNHAFANLPLTLKDTNNAVREAATSLNGDAGRSAASPRSNGQK